MNEVENTIIIDWLSYTTKTKNYEQIINSLGFEKEQFTLTKGAHGYKSRLYYDGVSVHYDGNNYSVWCEMSGQGCRNYETYGNGDYQSIFDNIINGHEEKQYNITRLDIAYDDKIGLIDIKQLAQDILNQNYVSKMNAWEVIQSDKGICINIGSPQSDVKIRIYDKALERHYTDGRHWIRIEIQMRDDRAYQFIEIYNSCDDIGYVFKGVLHNYLRVVIPNENDENKSRWQTAEYWQRLIDDIDKITIYKKVGNDYNMNNVKSYVINQAGGAIETFISTYGVNRLMEMITSRKTKKNPKYDELIKKYGRYDINEIQKIYSKLLPEEIAELEEYKNDIENYISRMRIKTDDEFYNNLRDINTNNH